jgi:hypothetical protein
VEGAVEQQVPQLLRHQGKKKVFWGVKIGVVTTMNTNTEAKPAL